MGFIITMETTPLKRQLVKYIRDKAKHAYNKKPYCEICGSDGDGTPLDFHHFYSVTNMLDLWLKKNKLNPTTAEEIMAIREQFISEHNVQMYEKAVTLCHKHHEQLHKIYGSKPLLTTAPKQENWFKKQQEKYGNKGLDSGEAKPSSGSN